MVSFLAEDKSGNQSSSSFIVTVQGISTAIENRAFSSQVWTYPNPAEDNLFVDLSDIAPDPITVQVF